MKEKFDIDTYAVIGCPVEHSLSPQVHNLFAKQTQQVMDYIKLPSSLETFADDVDHFLCRGGKGLNITVPFKEKAFQLVDELDKTAVRAQAVNTIVRHEDRLIGYNTDGQGLVADLQKNLHFPLHRKKVLLLGAGGAAAGVLPSLLDALPSELIISNRTFSKVQALVDRFHGCCQGVCFDDLAGHQFDLVINATSCSLQQASLSIPTNIFSSLALSYDMFYSHESTTFMRWSTKAGAKFVSDGLGMLIEQGAVSFSLWRGVMPDTQDVLKSFMLY